MSYRMLLVILWSSINMYILYILYFPIKRKGTCYEKESHADFFIIFEIDYI